MSTTYQLNESAKFFFENAKKVNQAYETIIEGHRFMIEQYRLIASKLGLDENGSDISVRSYRDKKIDTYFVVTTHDIILGEGFKYKIILELSREDKDRLDELRNKFSNHFKDSDKIQGSVFPLHAHFLFKEYETSLDDLGSFADQVVENIKNDFWELFVKVVQHLYKDKLKNDERWQEEFKKINSEN